jgi:excisionase family DNA binding protein
MANSKVRPSVQQFEGYYTAQGAAKKIGVTVSTIQVQVWRGTIKGIKVGGAWLISEEEVLRYRTENKGNVGRPPKATRG